MQNSQSTQSTQKNIILIGDDCTDIYQYGIVDRISPEAPVPILKITNVIEKGGMVSNVESNLKAFKNTNIKKYSGTRSIKTRIIDERTNQHILRLDEEPNSIEMDVQNSNIDFDNADIIIISDYNKGFLSYTIIEEIITKANKLNIPIFIDTKKTELNKFKNAFIKINELEYNNANASLCDNLIVTRASKEVQYKDNNFEVPRVPVQDVCGAGDTFLAHLAMNYLIYKDFNISIPKAIKASSITVQKTGVYAPELYEIKA